MASGLLNSSLVNKNIVNPFNSACCSGTIGSFLPFFYSIRSTEITFYGKKIQNNIYIAVQTCAMLILLLDYL